MKALVTGGTGFVGSHLTEALLKKGFEVRCLLRDPSRPGWLKGLRVEIVRGDCNDPESLEGPVEGVEYVFHAAGVTKAARPGLYYEANAEGTGNIAVAAARAGGLKKFIYVSSQAAAGPSAEGVPRKEDDPPAPVSDYGKSKLEGERHVTALEGSLDSVIIRPPSVYGPRDRDIYTFFKMISRGIRTTFRERRLISLCYVEDLADGIIAAAEGETRSGEAFFISGPAYTWDEIGLAMAGALGVKPVAVTLPVPLMRAVALFAEGLAALAGKPALLNRQKMAEIRQRFWVVDTGKARERLGFTARHDIESGTRLTALWYRKNGWL